VLPNRLLSKSKHLNGLQCPRYLWIACNDPGRIPEPDMATQHIFDQGHLVGEHTKKLSIASVMVYGIHGRASGIGVSVASAVLHFMYPDRFPLIDIRTAETHYVARQTRSPDRADYRVYSSFRSAILLDAQQTGCSLHEIDAALFAYHRDVIQPRMEGIWQISVAPSIGATPTNLRLDADPRVRCILLDYCDKCWILVVPTSQM